MNKIDLEVFPHEPCPFCGSVSLRHECTSSCYSVVCNECCCYGPSTEHDSERAINEATELWNRRSNAQEED